MNEHMKLWSDAFRANFSVCLLAVLFAGMLAFTLHMSHDGMDKELVSWGRESSNAILGAILLCLKTPSSSKPPDAPPAPPQS
jgi:hypothetical protein